MSHGHRALAGERLVRTLDLVFGRRTPHADLLAGMRRAAVLPAGVQAREALRLAAYARDRYEARDQALARTGAQLGLDTEPTGEETQDGAGLNV